jgi:uncharacterized protein involved in exopolysaccharide biosynthesis
MNSAPTAQRASHQALGSDMSGRELGIADYLRILWRRAFVIALVLVVCGVAAFAASSFMKPTYEASVLVSISPSRLSGEATASPAAIASFRTLMDNRTLARDVIEELGLSRPPSGLTPASFLNEHVTIDEIPRTGYVRLRVRLGAPDVAARAANRLAERAIDLSRRLNQQDDAATRDFINQQLEQTHARMRQLGDSLKEYQRSAGNGSSRGAATVLPDEPGRFSLNGSDAARRRGLRRKDAELADRELEFELAAKFYSDAAAIYEDARIRALPRNTQLTIADPAIMPDRAVAPRPLLNAAVAMTIALILSIAVVVAYEFTPRRR